MILSTAIKKEHCKATHNYSAFIVGERSEIKRTSDDGEPSGTAGIPNEAAHENDVTWFVPLKSRYGWSG